MDDGFALKSLVVVYSYHHNSTLKIAEVFAKVLDARIVAPHQTNSEELQEYALIGFGSGIDSGKHYKPLLDFADNYRQSPIRKPSFSQQVESQTPNTKLRSTPS